MKREEAQQQAIVVQWARSMAIYQPQKYPFLGLLHASLNGVPLTVVQRSIAKGQGQLNGVCDLLLPVPRKGKNGLFIEMKSKKGVLSNDQKEFIKNVEICGYQANVCYSASEAIRVLEDYYLG